jgi:SH3-like domain-containing protein
MRRRIALGSVISFVVVILLVLAFAGDKPESQDPVVSIFEDPAETPAEQNGAIEQEKRTVRLRGITTAFETPHSYWSVSYAFLTDGLTEYERQNEENGFVQIRNQDQIGWVPEWYVLEDGDTERAITVNPYEMIVAVDSQYYLYPGEADRTANQLDKGSVVQIQKEFQDWYGIEFINYAEPMEGDKWIKKDALKPYEAEQAREGYAWNNRNGIVIYNERNEEKEYWDIPLPVVILSEMDEMYEIGSTGGNHGWIHKRDFIPNPFTEEGLETHLPLSYSAKSAYERYVDTLNDEELAGLEPLDVFKMYYHAELLGDHSVKYALFIKDEEYELPSYDEYLSDSKNRSESTEHNQKIFIDRLAVTELKQILLGEEAIVQPADSDSEDWGFQLLKNKDGIWKVAWLPLQ